MAMRHCARVCAVGTEADMRLMCQVMLDNIDYWEEPVDRPPYTLKELQEQLHHAVCENGPETDGFLYEMISPKRYGSAETGTLRLRIDQDGCGLWYACFAYESVTPFQTREWIDLHKRCSHMLMVALRASEDLGGENGEIIFTAGGTLDNWDSMLESWMWLMEQYECGYPPEEAVARLDRLQAALEADEYDMSVDELLGSCERNLSALALDVQDSEALRQGIAQAVERRDFSRLMEYAHAVAEAALWETEHNAKWLACIGTIREAWLEHMREGV